MCAPWDFATMHGYTAYATFARNRLDPEVVPFYYDMMASFSNKRVLFSEFGNPQCADPTLTVYPCLTEKEMATYAAAVLERLQSRGALGAYWWCYTDYDDALHSTPPFDQAPHELSFGAWRADGSPKPVVEVLTRVARAAADVAPAPTPDVIESDYYAHPVDVKTAYAAFLRREAT